MHVQHNVIAATLKGQPEISRRRALSLGAGIIATVAAVTATTVEAPAAAAAVVASSSLRALITKWRKARRMVEGYSKTHTAAEERAIAMRPARPVRPETSNEEMEAFRKLTIAEVAGYKWKADSDDHKAAFEQWTADCERAEKESGLEIATAEWNRLLDVESDAAYEVMVFPVSTLADLAAKLRVHAVYNFEADELAEIVTKDVRRIRKVVRA